MKTALIVHPDPPRVAPPLTEAVLLEAFQGPLEPVRTSWLYRLGLSGAGLMMVLLPLVYFTLIALVGALLVYHAVEHTDILFGRGRLDLRLLLYAGPLLVGLAVIGFMLKPLLARPAGHAACYTLQREEAPLLFAFVEAICRQVGAPPPRRIDVDTSVNASASFGRGFFSFLRRDLVLTIGMPLVLAMSMRQLGGVLAHEIGHFAQGGGLRVSYVIRGINGWFERLVNERNDLDTFLEASSAANRTSLIAQSSRFCIWLTRRLLWMLMYAGHLVSSFLLRQMEYDADRWEARFAGVDTFEATTRDLALLSAAAAHVHTRLRASWRDERLPDDLPALIVATWRGLPQAIREEVLASRTGERTGRFDSHPADEDRLANVRREGSPGIFRLALPASVLFQDAERCARMATRAFFTSVLGRRLTEENLVELSELSVQQQARQEAERALMRYFGAVAPARLPRLHAPEEAPVDEAAQAVQRLVSLRTRWAEALPLARRALEAYARADARLVEMEVADALYEADVRVKPERFGLTRLSLEEIEPVRRTARHEQQEAEAILAPFEAVCGERLRTVLGLLRKENALPDLQEFAALREQSETLVEALDQMGRAAKAIGELRLNHAAVAVLLQHRTANAHREEYGEHLERLLKRMVAGATGVHQALSTVAYPFEHARGALTITDYLLSESPDEMLGRFHDCYFRTLGELALIAERVEASLGLQPLLGGEAAVPSA